MRLHLPVFGSPSNYGVGATAGGRRFAFKFVRFVADTRVMSYRDPTSRADGGKPFFIRTGWSEMIAVTFNAQSCRGENVRKPVAEVAIRKENNAQAARS